MECHRRVAEGNILEEPVCIDVQGAVEVECSDPDDSLYGYIQLAEPSPVAYLYFEVKYGTFHLKGLVAEYEKAVLAHVDGEEDAGPDVEI